MTPGWPHPRVPFLIVAIAAVGAWSCPAAADEPEKYFQTSISSVFAAVARDTKEWMFAKGMSEISIGRIAQLPGMTTEPGVVGNLAQALRLENLIVKLGNAPQILEGQIEVDRRAGEIIFEFRICDKAGKEVRRLTKRSLPLIESLVVSGEEETVKVIGTNNDAMRLGGTTATSKATLEQLAKPETLIGLDGKQVFAAGADDYRIEILHKAGNGEYQAYQPRLRSGQAVVNMLPDAIFGVRLINRTDKLVAVILEINGVNCFVRSDAKVPAKVAKVGDRLIPATLADGSEALKPAFTHYLINKKDTALIRGWYRNEEKHREFIAGDDPEWRGTSANQTKLGTITAQFYRAWDEANPEAKPVDAPRARRFTSQTRRTLWEAAPSPSDQSEASTGLRKVQWEEVHRATVSVRYEK